MRRLETPQWLNDSLIDLGVRTALFGVTGLPSANPNPNPNPKPDPGNDARSDLHPNLDAGAGMDGWEHEAGSIGSNSSSSSSSISIPNPDPDLPPVHALNSLFYVKLTEKTTDADRSDVEKVCLLCHFINICYSRINISMPKYTVKCRIYRNNTWQPNHN